MDADAASGGSSPRLGLAPLLSLGLAALLVVSGGAIGLGVAMGGGGHGVMWGGAPVAPPQMPIARAGPRAAPPAGFQLTGLPPDTVERYTSARANAEVFAQIPCFCGCAAMLGHRNLAECFVTPSGAWESHAAGCQVCLGEARMVMRMMGRGMGPATMRDRIVAEFGGPTASAPTMGTSA